MKTVLEVLNTFNTLVVAFYNNNNIFCGLKSSPIYIYIEYKDIFFNILLV